MKVGKLGSSMTESVRTWLGIFVATDFDPVFAQAHRLASDYGVLIHA